jgi:hypothetical protein
METLFGAEKQRSIILFLERRCGRNSPVRRSFDCRTFFEILKVHCAYKSERLRRFAERRAGDAVAFRVVISLRKITVNIATASGQFDPEHYFADWERLAFLRECAMFEIR